MREREGPTLERLAELLAVVGGGRDGGGDLERRHRRGALVAVECASVRPGEEGKY